MTPYLHQLWHVMSCHHPHMGPWLNHLPHMGYPWLHHPPHIGTMGYRWFHHLPHIVTPSVEENNDTTVQDQPWYLQQSAELSKCREFVRTTCGCSKANGKPCSTLFSEEHYIELRAQAAFLSHEQLDLVLSWQQYTVTNFVGCGIVISLQRDRRPWWHMYMHHGDSLYKNTWTTFTVTYTSRGSTYVELHAWKYMCGSTCVEVITRLYMLGTWHTCAHT